MKHTIISAVIIIMVLAPFCSHGQEGEEAKPKPGFHWSVMLGGGWVSGRASNEEVGEDNERIESYGQKGKSYSSPVPVFSGGMSYVFGQTGTTVFIGNSSASLGADTAALSAGVSQDTGGYGNLAAVVSYGSTEVWKDPYLLGADREKTDEKNLSAAVSWDDLLDTPLSVRYALCRTRVDEDEIGAREPDLRRDGMIHDLGMGFALPLCETFVVTTNLSFTKGVMDGKSAGYDGYGGDLGCMLNMNSVTLTLTGGYGSRRYDRAHPVFHKVRQEREGTVSGMVIYPKPFEYEKATLYLLVSHNRKEANIRFFEGNASLTGVGIGYEF